MSRRHNLDAVQKDVKMLGEELQTIWDKLGICEEQQEDRVKTVVQHFKVLMDDMLREENNLLLTLTNTIENNSVELGKLNEELALPHFEYPDGLTMLQLDKELRWKIEEVKNEKYKRLKTLKRLRDQNVALSLSLGSEAFYIPIGCVPTYDFLASIEDHSKAMMEEKEHRLNTFSTIRKKIEEMSGELERNVPRSCEDTNFLSLENLAKLKALQQELEQSIKNNDTQAAVLREDLLKLWDRLHIDQRERDRFLDLYPGYRPSTITALTTEIEKLRILQRQNVKKFVKDLRQELVELWDKCFYGAEQRDLFRAFHDDSFTEELLDLHILEVDKVKSYFDENRDILNKITHWQQLWQKMLEFERKACDPNRFNNRGGNLLQEEKERKKLMKELPKLEIELEKLAMEWETKHDKIFCINSQRLVDYINSQWDTYRLGKENEKAERQKAKVKQIEDELYKGSKMNTPSKRKLPPDTPVVTSVRKRQAQENRVPKGASAHSSLAAYHSPLRRFPRSGRVATLNRTRRQQMTPGVVRRATQRRNEAVNRTTGSTIVAQNTSGVSVSSTLASYKEFSDSIQKRSEGIFNSTVVRPFLTPEITQNIPEGTGALYPK